MNDNTKEINAHKKQNEKLKPLKVVKNTTGCANIGSAGQPEILQKLSTLSTYAFSQSPEHGESKASINSGRTNELADVSFRKRTVSNEISEGQRKIPKQDADSHFEELPSDSESVLNSDKNNKESYYDPHQTFSSTIWQQYRQDNKSAQDARFSNPGYLRIMGINDTNISKNNEVSSKSPENMGEYSQYQYQFSLEEKNAEATINELKSLENQSLPNSIKAVIAQFRSTIYEKCDILEAYLDANQYSKAPSDAWKALLQLSEFTEFKGKSFIDCLNCRKDYQDDYETTKYLTKDKIEKFTKQQDLAEGKQKQRIKDFIITIEQEFQNIKQDPIDTKFGLHLSIEEIMEEYQGKINKASEDLSNFNTLIIESSDKIADCFKSYQDYQDDYETHKDLTNARIKELEIWQDYMKGKQKQEIENFITTIEQGFQNVKQDPIDTEADITISVEQGTEEYNKQLIEASDKLSNFSTLVIDSYDEFIDKLKLAQVKELPMDILKSEIERLSPQASLFGDSTNLELHEFLPSLQMISEYGDNDYDARYNKQILEIRNNISKKYLNEISGENLGFPAKKNARNIIKDTLHKIGFPSDIPTNTPKNEGKEKAEPEQQVERDHKVHILNKLKSLQTGQRLKIMGDGARGLYQLGYNEQTTAKTQYYYDLQALVNTLRGEIISHSLGTPWPDSAITNLGKIRSELNKPRSTNNLLTQNLQDQINTFSNEFTQQRQQQK